MTETQKPGPRTDRFLFATGIECSYPTIVSKAGRTIRRDEMESCGHYAHWKQDLELTREMGIGFLRYGPPYYKMHLGAERFDWSWTDQALPEMRRLGIVPIIGLCHFGVPDWIENFQNPDFPRLFADYARAFARRYPWVRFYTPVNEMYVAARFSALNGWWNERLSSDKAFVTALKHLVRANVEGMRAILESCPSALFVQSESSQHTHTLDPALLPRANFLNLRRFLALDLNYAQPISAEMYNYVRDCGMSEDEYRYFYQHGDLREHCIMGNDYYVSNEELLVSETETICAGGMFGYYVVTREYFTRYNLPVMHTETNTLDQSYENAEHWLHSTWVNILRLRKDGIPVCGMTWYSLTDQIDWDTSLREDNQCVNPVGLFDLDRNIRPVGKAYRDLIQKWRDLPLFPGGPLTLASAAHPERETQA